MTVGCATEALLTQVSTDDQQVPKSVGAEQGLQMTFVKVLGHIAFDVGTVDFKSIGEALTHPCRHLVSDV